MRQDEAEKLALLLRPEDTDEGLHYDDFRALCDYILSGDHKREIENAAFELAAELIASTGVTMFEGNYEAAVKNRAWIRNQIRSLIQPPAQQKENGE